MDDTPPQPNPPHPKPSLPAFARSIPVEIAALPASTRTSFTRVDNTRPGTAVDDSDSALPDEPVPGPDDSNGIGGGSGADARGAPPHEDGQGGEETGAVVSQVPQTLVQFLLVSGRRRSMAFDPETTVGRVKELVWNTCPNCMLPFPSPSPRLSQPRTHTHVARACLRHMVHKSCGQPVAAATRPGSILNFIFTIYSFLLGTSIYHFLFLSP